MIKMFVLIMILSDGSGNNRPVTVIQEFTTIELCQSAMNSITSQVYSVHSRGCYEK